MSYAKAHTQLLPTPPPSPEDSDPLGLVKPVEALSLDIDSSTSTAWIPAFSYISPPSYDPMSPSYDPSAASPCNPFPTSSPFTTFTFSRPKSARKHTLTEPTIPESVEILSQPQSPVPPSQILSIPHLPPPTSVTQVALAGIPPPHSAPSLRRTKPCRFYLDSSGCKSGRWCNFKHPVGAHPEDRVSPEEKSLAELRAAVILSRDVKGATTGDNNPWDNVPDVRDIDPNWGKKGDDDVHPKWRTQPCRNFLLGICRYGDKCQFIHAPGLFPTAVRDAVALPAISPISVWGEHPGVGVPASSDLSGGSANGKDQQMSLFYRTKPCKYFDKDGTCPHGAECKFIHDPKKFASSPATSAIPEQSWADDDREIDFEDAPQFSEMDLDTNANSDPMMQDGAKNKSGSTGTRDRGHKKANKESGGIFKPTWRVVGGGVMLASRDRHYMRSVKFTKEPEDDVVLDHQPHELVSPTSDGSGTPDSFVQSPSPLSSETITIPIPFADDYNNYGAFTFNLEQYPPSELFRAPSPNAHLEISMAVPQSWNPVPRVKRVITGADLMRGIMESPATQDINIRNTRSRSKSPPKDKVKPRLTIAVPPAHTHRRVQSYGNKGTAGYTPYQTSRIDRGIAAQTETGDDILDWGEEDGADVEGDVGDAYEIEIRDQAEMAGDIRRVRSTPPTPRSSASYLDVPIMPRLPAESP